MSGTGIFETMRVYRGGLPLLEGHLLRLTDGAVALRLPRPSDALAAIARTRAGEGAPHRILRLAWSEEGTVWSERELGPERSWRVLTSGVAHRAYPVKSMDRIPFDRALAEAEAAGADEPLLLTSDGLVAEAARFALLWLDEGVLRYPAADLGVLPSLGVRRALDVAATLGIPSGPARIPRVELDGRSVWLVNAARGLVPVAALDDQPVPPSEVLAEVAGQFWPSA
ncbi:MAG: aminotransferase class IV [Gemmatimonadota bacterium]|nr:aminotransferase class IV [Gemmatimonadota bacterium]MDH4348716.1 aminotransferase class IV [Gemmatimonadota bacterium]MDH5196342.1 aminotransferase class IV [Gemmatimonadota bacterium]